MLHPLNGFPYDKNAFAGYITRYRWAVTGLDKEPLPQGLHVWEVFGDCSPDPPAWPVADANRTPTIVRLLDVYNSLPENSSQRVKIEPSLKTWGHHYTFLETYMQSHYYVPLPVNPDHPNAGDLVYTRAQWYTIEEATGPQLQEHLMQVMRGKTRPLNAS